VEGIVAAIQSGLIVFLMDWCKKNPALAFWKDLNIPAMMSTFYLILEETLLENVLAICGAVRECGVYETEFLTTRSDRRDVA